MDLVLARHPALAAGLERVHAADAEREQAGAWPNPEVELEAEGLGGTRAWSDPEEFTLLVGIPLQLFGTRSAKAGRAHSSMAREQAELALLRREIVADTWWSFHRALAADQRVEIARARVSVTRRTARALTAEVDTGKSSPLQGLRGEVEHQTARAELGTAIAARRTAHQQLAALWNEAVTDSLVLAGALRTPVSPLESAHLERELVASHPALEAAQWSVEVERGGEQLAARERWPVLVPRAGVRWYGDSDNEDFVASLSLDLPLFDRGNAARHAAARRTLAAGHDLEDVHRRLLVEWRSRWDELAARADALRAYELEIVPRAVQVLERTRIGHEHGKFGSLELLDAQRTWIAVEDGLAGARIDYDEALVRVESMLGRRLDAPHSPEENRP